MRSRRPASNVVDAVERPDRSDRHERIRRGDHHRVGLGQRVAGRGRQLGITVESDRRHGNPVTEPDEIVLERHLDRWCLGHGRVTDAHQCGAALVRHRHDTNRDVPRSTDLVGDLGQRRPFGQPGGPVEVCGEILVAEVEPPGGRTRTVGLHVLVAFERLDGSPGLADEAPPAFGVDRTGERVHDGVEVGRDRQTVQRAVVAGVDDRGDRTGFGHGVDQAPQEPGRADPAAHDSDARPRSRDGVRHRRRSPDTWCGNARRWSPTRIVRRWRCRAGRASHACRRW